MIALAKTSLLAALGLLLIVLLVLRIRRRDGVRIPLGITAIAFFAACYFSRDLFSDVLTNFTGASTAIIGQVFATMMWLAIAYTINVFVKRFGYQRRLTAEGDSKVPLIIQYLVTALIYMAAGMVILRFVFGQSIFALAATSGALAIVLGYSARSVLDEIFAGIALNFSSPFEKGDLVQLNDEWALIKDIGWRSITYLDMDSNNVVVPNSVVAASKIRNLDKPDNVTRRLYYFKVEYNAPPNVVIELAMAALAECPHIIDHEWNDVCLFDFDDTGIKYRVAMHIEHYNDWWLASNEYFNALWYRFKRADIRFAQQRHLNFQNNENADRALPDSVLDDTNWHNLVDRFDQTPMFDGMTKNDMSELARSAELHIVGPPERIIRAGSKRSSMYLMAAGKSDVYRVDDNGKETWMAAVGEGETVGLMSLLTGTPQRTTIRARTESAVWEIGSEALHALFERKPEVMDNIAAAVAQWQADEDEAFQAMDLSQKQEQNLLDKRTNTLYKRIARFFDGTSNKDEVNSDSYTDY